MRLNPDARLPISNDVAALKTRLSDIFRDIAINVNSSQNIINSDKTYSVPSDYASINDAITALRDYRIASNSTVTIQVSDGTYNLTSNINLNHPDGGSIRLIGNATTPTNCVLNWGASASGIDGLSVSSGNRIYIDGFHITRNAHSDTTISCGIVADHNSTIILGSHVKVTNWYYGIASRYGSYIKADSAIVDGAGDVGIWAFVDSCVDCASAVVTNTSDATNNLGFGIQAEYGSTVNCTSASSSGNRIAGIAALSGSSVRAHSATASSNTGSGLFARDGGTIEAHGATTSTNTRYGIEELTSGTVYYNSITQSGNTLGNRLPIAVFNADSSLGARVNSTSGPLRIDTGNASPVYFNTSGGLQASIRHTASSVNSVELFGSATGGAIGISAIGSDSNVDVTVKGKGTGSVFLGSSQANYARVNGASAGNVPAIYAEGSDSNIDLLLSGKGTGMLRFGAWTTSGDVSVNGYVTIKDAAGNTRKLATIA